VYVELPLKLDIHPPLATATEETRIVGDNSRLANKVRRAALSMGLLELGSYLGTPARGK
jgi:hypothetical protein